MNVLSNAPRHVVTRYLRGGCWILAIELSKKTKLPLWGIRDERGDLHHAFVADEENQTAIDIRGSMPLHNVALGCGAQNPRIEPIHKEEILALCGHFSRGEIQEAKRVINTMLRPSVNSQSEHLNFDI